MKKKHMKAAIWSFSKPSENSVIPSQRITRLLAMLTGAPVVYDRNTINPNVWLEKLVIVNGAYAFCAHLDVLAKLVRKAERIIWVQNDYSIVPPRWTSQGTSPFRAAFRLRHAHGGEPMELWSTCQSPAFHKGWGKRVYVNWNALTYEPLKWKRDRGVPMNDVVYYGSYRQDRLDAFSRYFDTERYNITISSPSKKFITAYGDFWNINAEPAWKGDLRKKLRRHGVGLYLEDRRSHKEFHSPANRFYEMLSAGLPMVFEPESVTMLERAGFDVAPYTARNAKEVAKLLRQSECIRVDQHRQWGITDYRDNLLRRVKKLLKHEGLR